MNLQTKINVFIGVIAVALGQVAASNTSAQSIGEVSIEANGPHYYVKTTDNNGIWATSNSTCTTPIQYLWIKPTAGGNKELLSLILTAKSTGLKIAADGDCGTGGNAIYFEVTKLKFDP